MQDLINKIHNGDCIEVMKQIEDNSIDLIVTSPPYDNLRTYNNSHSWDFEVFKCIAKELYRVIKEGGVIIWIVADATIKGNETGTSFKQALYFKELGLNLHDTMIYQKNNFSNPSVNRCHQIFEYMFVLVKGKLKTFNPIYDRQNICRGMMGSLGQNTNRKKDGSMVPSKKRHIKEWGLRYNIWKGNTSGQENMCKHILHPATAPLWLIRDHILMWSNKNDLVLDCFSGSGTTAIACLGTNRKYICIEKDEVYYKKSLERVEEYNKQLKLF
jgi:site-specific DNA-methyltransferase (adenine-specific)